MIICYLGGIGSGKSVSVVREIVLRSMKDQYAVTNFRLNVPKNNYHRLRTTDIIFEEEVKTISGRKSHRISVNWQYWDNLRESHKNYCIYLDELHNVASSRRSMTNINISLSRWVSQVRKILYDKRDSHLFLISQKLKKIDVDFRDLIHVFIECSKKEIGNNVFIIQKYYQSMLAYDMGIHYRKSIFRANPYFKYYDSFEMVKFEDNEVYL